MTELHITTKHEGKMTGMMSLSTNCMANPLCEKNHMIAGSICEKCYAQTIMKMRPRLKNACQRNVIPLTEGIIPERELPFINAAVFRFEAFGELYNENQLQNYVNIAKKNYHCMFALWTKNYDLAYNFFKRYKKPDNLNVILSSIMINQPIDSRHFLLEGISVKTFTVYRADFVEANGIEINCGARNCLECGLCYKRDSVSEIRELLKSDRKKSKKEVN